MRTILPRVCMFLTMLLALAACYYPRDPNDTLESVENGTLRLGIVANPPWAYIDAIGEPRGVEVRMVEALARNLNTEILWVEAPAPELLQAISRFELDLVIGGLTTESPGIDVAATTRTYYTSDTVVGVAEPDQSFSDVSDQRIAARLGTKAAAILQDEGANVIPVRELAPDLAPLAAPRWLVLTWDLYPTSITLLTEQHVLVIPPGENGWLDWLDSFLSSYSAVQIEEMLAEEVTS